MASKPHTSDLFARVRGGFTRVENGIILVEDSKDAEAALHELEEQFGALQDAVDDLIAHYTADPKHDYRILFWQSFDRLREVRGSSPASEPDEGAPITAEDVAFEYEDSSPAITQVANEPNPPQGAFNPASGRCESLNPKSTAEDRCERPAGHAGDHVGRGHSGSLVIYPSKWEDSVPAKRPSELCPIHNIVTSGPCPACFSAKRTT